MQIKSLLTDRLRIVAMCLAFLPGYGYSADVILTVLDEGAAVKMADVIAIDADTRNMLHSGFTDNNGKYRHTFAPGRLEIMIGKDEYAGVVLKDVVVKEKSIHKRVELILSAFASDGAPASYESDGCDD